MAIIRLTEKDKLPEMPSEYKGDANVRIEDANECEGLRCGERLEAALPPEDLQIWLETHAERPPVASHSHLIVSGLNPKTHEKSFAIFR
jgi:hypothetical protein